jgi:hypothetical protein
MKDYLTIGQAPCEEPCAQFGQPDYREKALQECARFIALLRKTFGPEPEGAWLSIKWFPHDVGVVGYDHYCEVVCHYNTEIPESVDYAYRCEAEMPTTWENG